MEIVGPIPVSDRVKYLWLRVIVREHSFVRIGLFDKEIPCLLLNIQKTPLKSHWKQISPGQPENSLADKREFKEKSLFRIFKEKYCCTMTSMKCWILPVAWLFSMASFGACFSGMLLWNQNWRYHSFFVGTFKWVWYWKNSKAGKNSGEVLSPSLLDLIV